MTHNDICILFKTALLDSSERTPGNVVAGCSIRAVRESGSELAAVSTGSAHAFECLVHNFHARLVGTQKYKRFL
jgi:hypothetical protein